VAAADRTARGGGNGAGTRICLMPKVEQVDFTTILKPAAQCSMQTRAFSTSPFCGFKGMELHSSC
jgi:hypothetical protein